MVLHGVLGSEEDVRVHSRCEVDGPPPRVVVGPIAKADPKGRSLPEGVLPVGELMPPAAAVPPFLRAPRVDRPATTVLGVGDGTSSCKQRAGEEGSGPEYPCSGVVGKSAQNGGKEHR